MRATSRRAGWSARSAQWIGLFFLAPVLFGVAEARPGRKHLADDKKTHGLGKPCQKRSSCAHRQQVCLKGMDANSKEEKHGFCALPCLTIEAGATKVVPGKPLTPDESTKEDMKKQPAPRCPKNYQCRSAGAGVPVDLCIQE